MARFTYHGPVQSISIATSRSKPRGGPETSIFSDVALVPGAAPIELPADHPIVLSMIETKVLRAVEDKSAEANPPASEKGAK